MLRPKWALYPFTAFILLVTIFILAFSSFPRAELNVCKTLIFISWFIIITESKFEKLAKFNMFLIGLMGTIGAGYYIICSYYTQGIWSELGRIFWPILLGINIHGLVHEYKLIDKPKEVKT